MLRDVAAGGIGEEAVQEVAFSAVGGTAAVALQPIFSTTALLCPATLGVSSGATVPAGSGSGASRGRQGGEHERLT